MIVCLCLGISDRAIAAAVEAGATGADAIAGATGAGSDCGCCRETIEAIASQKAPCSSPPCPGCARAGHRQGRDAP